MKYLILLMLMTGCGKLPSSHKKEAEYIKKAATLFCSCRNGIERLTIIENRQIGDSGFVECGNRDFSVYVENIKIACGKEVR